MAFPWNPIGYVFFCHGSGGNSPWAPSWALCCWSRWAFCCRIASRSHLVLRLNRTYPAWLWLTVRHGYYDGPNRNRLHRWFTELQNGWIFPWRNVSHNQRVEIFVGDFSLLEDNFIPCKPDLHWMEQCRGYSGGLPMSLHLAASIELLLPWPIPG